LIILSADNTWEPVENLDCPELIEDFENRYQQENQNQQTKRKVTEESALKKKKIADYQDVSKETQPRGFERGLIAEKILGATDSKGELMFLMKWKNSDEADLVPARIANVKCPQVVIRFYEERLMWHNTTGTEDEHNVTNQANSQSNTSQMDTSQTATNDV
jgi:hypothetical protein